MAASLAYLEQALEMGSVEMQALRDGDVEKASECAEKRAWLVSQAWSVRVPVDDGQYRVKLVAVQRMQEALIAEAKRCQESIRGDLNKSRKEGQRLAAYRTAAAHALQ